MAVEITISIPDDYVTLILDAFQGLPDKYVEFIIRDISDETFNGSHKHEYRPKDGGETIKQFSERVIKETIHSLIKMYYNANDRQQYIDTINSIIPVITEIPDEILE